MPLQNIGPAFGLCGMWCRTACQAKGERLDWKRRESETHTENLPKWVEAGGLQTVRNSTKPFCHVTKDSYCLEMPSPKGVLQPSALSLPICSCQASLSEGPEGEGGKRGGRKPCSCSLWHKWVKQARGSGVALSPIKGYRPKQTSWLSTLLEPDWGSRGLGGGCFCFLHPSQAIQRCQPTGELPLLYDVCRCSPLEPAGAMGLVEWVGCPFLLGPIIYFYTHTHTVQNP